VAVFIRYFGLPSGADEVIEVCGKAGVVSVDDWSHSFLLAEPVRLADGGADINIYSFKKLVPSLTGGGAMSRLSVAWPQQFARPPMSDSVRRCRQLLSGLLEKPVPPPAPPVFGSPATDDRLAHAVRSERLPAESSYPYHAEFAEFGMPASARFVLRLAALDQVIERRRQNYQLFSESLGTGAVWRALQPSLPPATCPWGYPVLLKDRGAHDYRLRALGVPFFTFGEVLHPLLFEQERAGSGLRETAVELADQLISLSVHQDLQADTIARHAEIINRYRRHQLQDCP
jgi:hypothetical protein